MIWDDTGFLLSKNRYNENSLISEIFTKNHGKVSGIIFGGTSKKIKNYLQIGNEIHVNFNSKSENKIGYFKIEIERALSPAYFENMQKLSCIVSAMQLVKLLTAESQSNKDIYQLINELYLLQKKDINYILNIKQEPKINSAPERYKRIYNYPALCLEFNPLYCKYYPPETRERILFILWIMKKSTIVLPLELVFLTLKQISLVEL